MGLLDVDTFPLIVNMQGVVAALKKASLDLDLALASLSDLLHFLPLSYFRRKMCPPPSMTMPSHSRHFSKLLTIGCVFCLHAQIFLTCISAGITNVVEY